MRAVEITSYGGPGVLRVAEVPKPDLRDGEVLVKVAASGVSHADVMQRQGTYPPPPGASGILGLECAGTVDGEPVCALLAGGGYAEYVAVPREQVLPVPERWTAIEAATLPENMFTVYDNLFNRAQFARGERILVHGGTSGIGSTAIMLARAFGASFVAATAGSPDKCDALVRFGADLAIDYKKEDFVQRVLDATQNRGVDVVIDIVGGDYIARDLQALAPDGRIVTLASPNGSSVQIDLGAMTRKRAYLLGSSLRTRTPAQKGEIARALRLRVWPLLPAKDTIRPVVDSVFPFVRAGEAHERMEASAHIGKIVLVP